MADKLSAIFMGAALVIGCAGEFPYHDKAGALATVEKTTELKNVQIKDDLAWFDCGKGDLFKTRFSAVNDRGQQVNGVVCKGIFKGSTIRYE